MLKKGPGTLWETFDDYSSRCQSSGTAIAFLFSKYIAGIYPAEPGYAAIGINPKTSGLNYLNAHFKTPEGHINLDWKLVGQDVEYNLYLPDKLKDKPIKKNSNIKLQLHTN